MSGYDELSQGICEICEGEQSEIVKVIDGNKITLRSMMHGYYLFGEIPIALQILDSDLHRHLKISMACFNVFDASIALADDNTLHASVYIPKPCSSEDLLSNIESLVNLIDVWVDMEKHVQS